MARKASAVGAPSPAIPKPKMAGGKPMTAGKAKSILSDGETRGTPLTGPQKGLFGAIAGGAPRLGGGSASSKRTAPKPMAIGQRPMLGARTKAAMKPTKPKF